MDFALTEEQQLIIKTTRDFVRQELAPHEREVEDTGKDARGAVARAAAEGDRGGSVCRQHACRGRRRRSRCGDLGAVREGTGLHQLRAASISCVARPSNILLACQDAQRERYLLPAVRGERVECLAMTEPQAGSDLRSMRDRRGVGGQGLHHQRHQAFHQPRRSCRLPRHPVRRQRRGGVPARQAQAHHRVPHRQGHSRASRYGPVTATSRTARLHQQHPAVYRLPRAEVRIPVLGERACRGFEVANTWLGATRLQVAANCVGRAEQRHSRRHGSGRSIGCSSGSRSGKFQGVSFKLADMAVELRAAGAANTRGGLEARAQDRHRQRYGDRRSSKPPRCWRWWPMRRCTNSRRDGTHRRPARSSVHLARCTHRAHLGRNERRVAASTSSRAPCCGRSGSDRTAARGHAAPGVM